MASRDLDLDVEHKLPTRGAPSVVQTWVERCCTRKMQTVLLCALRGCDTVRKEDVSKTLTRNLRSVILYNAEGNLDAKFLRSNQYGVQLLNLFEDLDHYPLHWVMHSAHASEIIAYRHPDKEVRIRWLETYRSFCEALHLLPETPEHLDIRLADAPYGEEEKDRYRVLEGGAPWVKIIKRTERVIVPVPVPELGPDRGYDG